MARQRTCLSCLVTILLIAGGAAAGIVLGSYVVENVTLPKIKIMLPVREK